MYNPVKMVLYVVLLYLYFITSTKSQGVGEDCYKNCVRGTCLLLQDCQASIRELRNRIMPQVCSFVGMDSVVCCTEAPRPRSGTLRPPLLTTTKRTRTTTEYIPPVIDYKFNEPDYGVEGNCDPIPPELTSPKTGQKAWDKCIEYQEKFVYPCENVNTLAADVTHVQKARVYRCNHNADVLIVGGVNATASEFPHMALLGFGDDIDTIQWLCGGSIISERFILTAGHCTYSVTVGPLTYALVGVLSRTEAVDSSQRYRIKDIIRHPGYKASRKYNDIALLKTDTEILLSSKVVPACLHVDTQADDQQALVTGWGATRNRGPISDVLQKVILNKFDQAECATLFPRSFRMPHGYDLFTQICYGDKKQSKDSCQGDSGGPLQLKSQRIRCMYTVVGVTSFGRGCGFIGQAGVYTRVSAYVPWIESVVWP
ncbi:trypsin-1-like [Battus philenor]|uniref:trypsin-1-like n=1 Tax=Battus philenor TaxID=42288 RepID=UPI0035CEA7F2